MIPRAAALQAVNKLQEQLSQPLEEPPLAPVLESSTGQQTQDLDVLEENLFTNARKVLKEKGVVMCPKVKYMYMYMYMYIHVYVHVYVQVYAHNCV